MKKPQWAITAANKFKVPHDEKLSSAQALSSLVGVIDTERLTENLVRLQLLAYARGRQDEVTNRYSRSYRMHKRAVMR